MTAERAFLHMMEGGCQVPIAGFATINDQEEITLTGLVGTPDGKIILKEQFTGVDAEAVGKEVAKELQARGAQKLIDEVKVEMQG